MQKIDGQVIADVELMPAVRQLVVEHLHGVLALVDGFVSTDMLIPGKMIRTRMAARLLRHCGPQTQLHIVENCCAATELVHTASLCHDDVIDSGLIRHSAPTLWRKTTCSAAVLIGDMLLCEALDMVFSTDSGRYTEKFVSKIKETCAAETEQELLRRGNSIDEKTCLHLARGKTGSFFSFAGFICGLSDPVLSAALEEAGYCIGTAYQLADDLLDVVGCDNLSGKSLGTDTARNTFTMASITPGDFSLIREHIRKQCKTAIISLSRWPQIQSSLVDFLTKDFRRVFEDQGLGLDVC